MNTGKQQTYTAVSVVIDAIVLTVSYVISYLIQVIVFGQLGYLKLEGATLIEFYVISACFTVMALWRHRQNIVRLLNGTENKFGMKKEK